VWVVAADDSRRTPVVDGRTDPSGAFAATRLPAGDYLLMAGHEGYFLAEPLPLTLPAPDELHFEFALELAARISG
jgi:hypothetical protein